MHNLFTRAMNEIVETAPVLSYDVGKIQITSWKVRAYGIYARVVGVSENERVGERSERVSFLIQKQRVRKYRTKLFPCCNLFISYLLRFFNPNQIFTLH